MPFTTTERKTKTCDPSWHWHEPHRKPIYQVAFNQADASQADVFAVVGARWVSIYRMPATESPPHAETAGTAAEKNGRKRKDKAAAAMGRLEPLQTYADDDTEESFYCVVWGADPSNGNAWLAVAGKRRQIRLIDCHRGVALRTMRGHGGAVHEVRFVPHAQASLLLSASEDESVRLWCCSTAYCLAIFAGQQGHRDAVLSLDVRPDAAYLATAGVDGTVRWHAHCMHTACTLDAHCMHTACTLDAHCMHTACTLDAPCMHTACAHCICAACRCACGAWETRRCRGA
jgi:WD40 repeat protein